MSKHFDTTFNEDGVKNNFYEQGSNATVDRFVREAFALIVI
jgi:hypothetical protein